MVAWGLVQGQVRLAPSLDSCARLKGSLSQPGKVLQRIGMLHLIEEALKKQEGKSDAEFSLGSWYGPPDDKASAATV